MTPVNYVLADEILDRFFSLLFQVFVDLFNNIKTGFVFSRKLFLVVDMLLEVSQEKNNWKIYQIGTSFINHVAMHTRKVSLCSLERGREKLSRAAPAFTDCTCRLAVTLV